MYIAQNLKTKMSVDNLYTNNMNTVNNDINKNIYPEGHPYHEIANEFVNKPLTHYKDALLNADAAILTDSALFCMAVNLPLKTKYCFYISRSNNYDYFYGSEYGYSKDSGKKVFHALTF